jgi:hypothetical protein
MAIYICIVLLASRLRRRKRRARYDERYDPSVFRARAPRCSLNDSPTSLLTSTVYVRWSRVVPIGVAFLSTCIFYGHISIWTRAYTYVYCARTWTDGRRAIVDVARYPRNRNRADLGERRRDSPASAATSNNRPRDKIARVR